MNRITRRKIDMGRSALTFSNAKPDTSEGYLAALTRLTSLLSSADQSQSKQRDGLIEVRAASVRKVELRELMRGGHLAHLISVVRVASREVPSLDQKFVFKPGARTFDAFRTAARAMAAAAEDNKEVLVRYGLVQTVLDNLNEALKEFDVQSARGVEGRQTHVRATAELNAVADEIVRIMKVMDGLNRYRFFNDPDELAAWESASNIAGGQRPSSNGEESEPTGDEVKPAA